MSAWAFSREAARPRSWSRTSSRRLTGLGLAFDNQVSQLAQAPSAIAKRGERGVSSGPFGGRHAPGFFQTVDGRKCGFLLGDVLARGLAEALGGFLDIEDVVDDLKGESDVLAEFGEGGEIGIVGFGVDGAHADAGAKQSAGLGAVNAIEAFGGGRLAFAFDVVDLTGNHAADGAGSGGEFIDEADADVGARVGQAGKSLKGDRAQGVAGENRHGFAVDFVIRRTAAAEVVVVHGG